MTNSSKPANATLPQPLTFSELQVLQTILSEVTKMARQHGANDFFMPYSLNNLKVAREVFEWGRKNGYFDEDDSKFDEVAEGELISSRDYLFYDYYLARLQQLVKAKPIESFNLAEHEVLAYICDELVKDEFDDFANALERDVHFDGDDNQHSLFKAIAQQQELSLDSGTLNIDILAVLRYLQARCLGQVGAPQFSVLTTSRLGIYKRWPTEKSLVKRLREFDPQRPIDSRNKANSLLNGYAKGENLFFDRTRNEPASPPFAFKVRHEIVHICKKDIDQINLEMLSGLPLDVWQIDFATLTYHYYWYQRMEFSTIRPFHKQSIHGILSCISDCLALSQLNEAHYLTEVCKLVYERGQFSSVNSGFPRPLYHWLLRICFDFWNIKFDKWGHAKIGPKIDPYQPGQCLGEPILNKMFTIWRKEDLSDHGEDILNLCDYYTSRTNTSDECEFSNDLFHSRYPAVILAWLRLRQQLGLSIPEIKHPLMQAPYAKLFEPVILPEDPLLTQVLQRLQREEIPHLFDASPSDKIFVEG